MHWILHIICDYIVVKNLHMLYSFFYYTKKCCPSFNMYKCWMQFSRSSVITHKYKFTMDLKVSSFYLIIISSFYRKNIKIKSPSAKKSISKSNLTRLKGKRVSKLWIEIWKLTRSLIFSNCNKNNSRKISGKRDYIAGVIRMFILGL